MNVWTSKHPPNTTENIILCIIQRCVLSTSGIAGHFFYDTMTAERYHNALHEEFPAILHGMAVNFRITLQQDEV
jgi:hypothetical protein